MSDEVPTIYVDDVVPATKKAVQEAVENVPDRVYVKIRIKDEHGQTIGKRKHILTLAPGQTQAYTDGKGHYFGRITRTLNEQVVEFIFDGNQNVTK